MNMKRISISFISAIIITVVGFYLLILNGYQQVDIQNLESDKSLTILGLEYFKFEANEGANAEGVPNNFNMALVGMVMGILIFFVLELWSKRRNKGGTRK
ncbi:LlsX family protein [Virgibacillus alimentarius]|uniref:LlsX family protein n=1 Tax=Virgibacillus alimentarius TaxID=698769 RepID=UPI000492F63A|nr:LlsX family protein [Virgibacillus alimentarius]